VGAKALLRTQFFLFQHVINFFNSQHGAPEKNIRSGHDVTSFLCGAEQGKFLENLQLSGHARPLVYRAGRTNPFCELAGPLQLQHQRGLCDETLIVAYLRAKKTRV